MTEERTLFKCPKCNSEKWHVSFREDEKAMWLSSPCGNTIYVHIYQFENFVNTILDKLFPLS